MEQGTIGFVLTCAGSNGSIHDNTLAAAHVTIIKDKHQAGEEKDTGNNDKSNHGIVVLVLAFCVARGVDVEGVIEVIQIQRDRCVG